MRPQPTQTWPRGGAEGLLKEHYRGLLEEARERTLWLVASVSDEDMERVHSTLMSPLVWDLGHIAAFEDLWLCQQAGGLVPLRPDLADVYDATETPRADRGELSYLRQADALEYMAEVRERALAVLDRADLSGRVTTSTPWSVWDMLVQHEHQHNETMLQTLPLAGAGRVLAQRRPLPARPPGQRGPDIGAGRWRSILGSSADGFAYDNERPRARGRARGLRDRPPAGDQRANS